MENRVAIKITGDASSLVKAAGDSNQHLEKLGTTAKNTSLAMRQVPMQFTDIVVSLQSGQNPMQVFLQQGGQLKDLFGGIGPAAKALGGYVVGLINPFSLAAAAAAGLGAAYYAGSEETTRLNTALITTGNILGQTAGQLTTLAETVGEATGHYGTAREAVEALASSGKISSDQLKDALKGVVAGVDLTGKSVEDLVQEFEGIAKDPVKGITALNEKYNFLTVDIYKQITALQEQGKNQEAVTLGIKTYADTLDSRKTQVIDNLGFIEAGWLAIKKAASGATDSVLAFGRAKTDAEKINEAKSKLNFLESKTGYSVNGKASRQGSDADIAEQKAIVADLERQKATAEYLAADYGKYQQTQKDKISQQDAYKKYTGDNSRFSRSDLLKKNLEDEQKEFEKAVRGLDEKSAEYQQALLRHNQKIANIKDADANKDKKAPKATELDLRSKQSQDVAALSQDIIKLNVAEKTNVEILQDKLNAYSNLDPALRTYLQGQIDQASAANAAAVASKQQDQYLSDLRNWDEEQAKIEQSANDEKFAAAEAIAEQLKTENENLNVALIEDDKKRALAQLELEHQRSLDRIEGLQLESEEAQSLIEAETRNYELKIKNIDSGLNKTKSLSKEFGITFNSALEDAIVNGEDLGNVLDGLGKDIDRMLTRRTVTEPLMKGIDGLLGGFDFGSIFDIKSFIPGITANAKGNVYSGESISAYSGSVVSSPTFFANGGNVMGEAGPEGIFPLKRGKDGKLGVSADGVMPNVVIENPTPAATENATLSLDIIKNIDSSNQKLADVFSATMRDIKNVNVSDSTFSTRDELATLQSKPVLTSYPDSSRSLVGDESDLVSVLKRTKNSNPFSRDVNAAGNVTVNIIGAPQQPKVQQRNDGNGNFSIDVIFDSIKSAFTKDIRSEGQFAQVLQNQYGLNRAAGAR